MRRSLPPQQGRGGEEKGRGKGEGEEGGRGGKERRGESEREADAEAISGRGMGGRGTDHCAVADADGVDGVSGLVGRGKDEAQGKLNEMEGVILASRERLETFHLQAFLAPYSHLIKYAQISIMKIVALALSIDYISSLSRRYVVERMSATTLFLIHKNESHLSWLK